MSEYCNYCKTEISINDNVEATWKISMLSIAKQNEFKKENYLVCSVCLEVYYNNSEEVTKIN